MELHSKVAHQVGVLDSFEDFQLVCRLLNGFVVVRLEPDLHSSETGKEPISRTEQKSNVDDVKRATEISFSVVC